MVYSLLVFEFYNNRSLCMYFYDFFSCFCGSFMLLISIMYTYYSEKEMAPHSSTLAWKIHGQRSLVGCSHGVAKTRARLSDFTFTFHFHALEKEMAIHSNVLAWRIPGVGKSGGLPSMGSHTVGHD